MEEIYKKVKGLRLEKKLTLKELSEQTGLSLSFLSQIERGASSLSITSLKKIANALDVSMIYFFSEENDDESYFLSQENHNFFRVNGGEQFYARLAGSFYDRKLEPMKVVLPPFMKEDNAYSHAGEEFYYVLQGKVTFHVSGTKYELVAGDTIHFPSELRHFWENPTHEEAVIISVSTPVIF